MKLLNYMNGLDSAERDRFAAACATTWGYLKQVAYGNKNCGPALAINIERETKKAVTCEELCPSEVDWPYIRASADQNSTRAGE